MALGTTITFPRPAFHISTLTRKHSLVRSLATASLPAPSNPPSSEFAATLNLMPSGSFAANTSASSATAPFQHEKTCTGKFFSKRFAAAGSSGSGGVKRIKQEEYEVGMEVDA